MHLSAIIGSMAELMVYIIVMSITPGPNTILSLSNAAAVGLRKGVRLNIGMLIGITAVTAISYAFSSLVYALLPSAELCLRMLAFIYLMYLAWKTYRKGEIENDGKSASFLEGLLLQLVNVKVYLLALTAISTYIIPQAGTPTEAMLLSAIIPITCFISGLVWAVGGSLLSAIYSRYRRPVCLVLALSLVYCAVRIFV